MTVDRPWSGVSADRERGSGTVVVVGLVAVVVVLAATVGLVASAHLGRVRAQTAADLAALAGAGDLVLPLGVALAGDAGRDTGTACVTARETAVRNGAELTGCGVGAAGDVQVTVRVSAAGGAATAVARAGPAHLREE